MDKERVVHTVALHEPWALAPPPLLKMLEAQPDTDRAFLARELDVIRESSYESLEEVSVSEENEEEYVGTPIPSSLVDTLPASLEGLLEVVQNVPFRWRIDMIDILEDILDHLDET